VVLATVNSQHLPLKQRLTSSHCSQPGGLGQTSESGNNGEDERLIRTSEGCGATLWHVQLRAQLVLKQSAQDPNGWPQSTHRDTDSFLPVCFGTLGQCDDQFAIIGCGSQSSRVDTVRQGEASQEATVKPL